MSSEVYSVLGSGSVPLNYRHSVPPQNATNAPPTDVIFRKGQEVVIINPEDFSAHIDGGTKQTAVAGTAVRVDIGRTYRRAVALKNMSSTETVFIGFTAAVTISTGFPLFGREGITLDATNILNLYAITAGPSATVAALEVL